MDLGENVAGSVKRLTSRIGGTSERAVPDPADGGGMVAGDREAAPDSAIGTFALSFGPRPVPAIWDSARRSRGAPPKNNRNAAYNA